MNANVGGSDRMFRLIAGFTLLLLTWFSGVPDSILISALTTIAGLVFIVTGLVRFCPLYTLFGIRTCRR
ncbi:YgaP family membrane protein [Halocynthiibacter sp.]|uniref:YgaP family membrane protein n=1 Tax=Halocynthiibacter sp. TaxID=1979210 RepID=UPI003C410248